MFAANIMVETKYHVCNVNKIFHTNIVLFSVSGFIFLVVRAVYWPVVIL